MLFSFHIEIALINGSISIPTSNNKKPLMSLDAFFVMQAEGAGKKETAGIRENSFNHLVFIFTKKSFDSFMHNKQLK